jgi:hypothetical protein
MMRRRKRTQSELDYAFRRVIYDLMVAAHALLLIDRHRNSFPIRAVNAIAALIMARNINDFLYCKGPKNHQDDIDFVDFQISAWTPDAQSKLSEDDRNRISKIVGHIVSSDPVHFGGPQTIKKVVVPLLLEGCAFVRQCRDLSRAGYTGRAKEYQNYLNDALHGLGLPQIQ